MACRQFEKIKRYLCFADEQQRIKKGQPGYDPLFRIRNVSDMLNERFDSVPKTTRLCVDEQMCATKMSHHLRQYLPNKPHKWGIKLFVLCDSYGYSYRFEIYNGAGDNVIIPGMPDLGATSNVVVRLTRTVPNFVNHIIYFDNLYTSLPLLVYLRARGIYALGTIRANRIPNCKLPTDKDSNLASANRGYSVEYVGTAYGVDISTVLWKDTKNVRLASTYVGVESFVQTTKIAQPSKAPQGEKYIEIDCPQIIKEYNNHMGGVDLMDSLMGRYHIRLKTRNPMLRLFYHMIDMAMTNAYILYRRIHTGDVILMQLPKFREQVAASLCKYKPNEKRVVGRPSMQVSKPTKSGTGQKASRAPEEVRYDGTDHFPGMHDRSGKRSCKQCKKSDTQIYCMRCNLNLC